MLPATSIAKHSLVYSSITVRHFSCCPLAQASNRKSYAQTWFAPVGARGLGRCAATRRRGLFLGTCRPCSRHSRCIRSALITCPPVLLDDLSTSASRQGCSLISGLFGQGVK